MSGGAASPVLLVHPGPHGVAAYARDIAAAVVDVDVAEKDAAGRDATPGAPTRIATPDALAALPAGTPVHAHVTDRLWGASPEEATVAVLAVAGRHPLTVTLHDVPQASDGERNRPRRRAFYRAVAEASAGVAVNSRHEASLLAEEDVWHGPVAVVPLPVDAAPAAPAGPTDASVGVLGFFYPGKGHDEALAAAVAAGIARLSVLGRASDGHADDLAAFVRRGADAGVEIEVTGWLDDAAMAARARAVAVPVIAHRHISASGSLASWIGWGRAPIAVRNRYVDEMAALRPGTLHAVDDAGLAAEMRRAVVEPERTWHGIHPLPFGRADAARAYRAWWAGLAG